MKHGLFENSAAASVRLAFAVSVTKAFWSSKIAVIASGGLWKYLTWKFSGFVAASSRMVCCACVVGVCCSAAILMVTPCWSARL